MDVEGCDGYDVDVFNDKGEAEELEEVLRQQLEDLGIKETFEYPSAGKAFRDAAKRVCKAFGFEASGLTGYQDVSRESSERFLQERIVVGNLSEFTAKLHEENAVQQCLGFVSKAFRRRFSDLTRLEKEVIQREARLKGYMVIEDDTGLKVAKLLPVGKSIANAFYC